MKAKLSPYQPISDALKALEHDESLAVADNFGGRVRAIDTLELYEVDGAGEHSGSPLLVKRATVLRHRLEDANTLLIDNLLTSIRAGNREPLTRIIGQVGQGAAAQDEGLGYDELDALIAALLDVGIIPDAPPVRDPDMIAYQPTPARIVLKLIAELDPARDDVFYDLGSGLGHVPILINLLTGIKTVGVELEKSYCQVALASLNKLNLRGVALIQADARHVSYHDGTIFYLYTPFQGEILKEVLAKLEAQGKRRGIKVCAYGPCVQEIDRHAWLKPIVRMGEEEASLGIYTSF